MSQEDSVPKGAAPSPSCPKATPEPSGAKEQRQQHGLTACALKTHLLLIWLHFGQIEPAFLSTSIAHGAFWGENLLDQQLQPETY